jgi:hypothetical protein
MNKVNIVVVISAPYPLFSREKEGAEITTTIFTLSEAPKRLVLLR